MTRLIQIHTLRVTVTSKEMTGVYQWAYILRVRKRRHKSYFFQSLSLLMSYSSREINWVVGAIMKGLIRWGLWEKAEALLRTYVSVCQPEAARATRITLSPDMTKCFHPESLLISCERSYRSSLAVVPCLKHGGCMCTCVCMVCVKSDHKNIGRNSDCRSTKNCSLFPHIVCLVS